MALLIFFIFWRAPSYSVIPLTNLMVIGKLDITVYFRITPVHLYIIPRGFSYLIGRKSTCSPWWFGQVSPGSRDRDAVKFYQNHCLTKMGSFLTLNYHNNFFGRKTCCCLQKLKSLYSLRFIVTPNVLVTIIHLIIFLAACCEIWQIQVNLWFDWMTSASWEDLSSFNKLQPYQSIQ